MINLKIKYLRWKIKRKNYYLDRLNQLIAHKEMLDRRFAIFEWGIVGERIWELEGTAYLDYCHRIRPMIINRMDWYRKKSDKNYTKAIARLKCLKSPTSQ